MAYLEHFSVGQKGFVVVSFVLLKALHRFCSISIPIVCVCEDACCKSVQFHPKVLFPLTFWVVSVISSVMWWWWRVVYLFEDAVCFCEQHSVQQSA